MSDETLNVRIAKLAGWRVTSATEPNGYTFMVTHWNLFTPDGTEVIDVEHDPIWYGDTMGYASEADAWAHVPDYEHDADVILAALPSFSEITIQQHLDWGEIPEYGSPEYDQWFPTAKSKVNGYEAIVTGLGYNSVMSDGNGMYRGTGAMRQEALALAYEAYLLWQAEGKA